MDTRIIESDDAHLQTNTVAIGSEKVSLKILQDVYNKITGKTESLKRTLTDSHLLTFEDLNQLNTKIEQLYSQYNIQGKQCSVTVYHTNDCSEEYSSFERFRMYDSSLASPCENLTLEYNFLIVLPDMSDAQNYKIRIDLHSRVALKERAKNEDFLPKKVFRIFSRQTGIYKIDYIDYTVARTFKVALDDWYSSLSKAETSKMMSFLAEHSSKFPKTFRIISVLIVTFSFSFYSNTLLGKSPTLSSLFSLAMLAYGTIVVLSLLSVEIGRTCEDSVDDYQTISGIHLTKGDKAVLDKYEKSNKRSLRKALGSALLAFAINILAAIAISWIGI